MLSRNPRDGWQSDNSAWLFTDSLMTVSYSKIKVVPSVSYAIFNLIILQIKPTWCTVFLSMFISFLYIVLGDYVPIITRNNCMRHLVFVSLCGWLSGMQGHTRQSSTQSGKYQVSHRYSCFSWWWAHSRPKQCRGKK